MISTTLTAVDREVFHRYAGLSLPRHVSYPMPTWWRDAGDEDAALLRQRMNLRARPVDLSLYAHIPFCESMCKFCACSRLTLRKTSVGAAGRVEAYLQSMIEEIGQLGESYGRGRKLRQIHWGGGTPTYLSDSEMERLINATKDAFDVAEDAEISIEVDPRVVSDHTLKLLRKLGFNRISLGVQDFNETVQKHVKRIQPFEMVRRTVDCCRSAGFESINFDLIYGLPYQTLDTMGDTLARCIELAPDRVAYYHYAQVPDKIATQRAIHHDKMPDSETKLAMFMLGVELFTAAGYDFIGLDHFARPDEMLSEAAKNGTLQRNFQGMTTGAGLDLLGVGASSISHILEVGFLQNQRDPDAYVQAMTEKDSALTRVRDFSDDDCIRQAVLTQIYCGGRIVPSVIEERFGIDFGKYFSRELVVMDELEGDGLIRRNQDETIDVTFPLGRVLMRNVAAVFDAYLQPDAYRMGERHCFSANA